MLEERVFLKQSPKKWGLEKRPKKMGKKYKKWGENKTQKRNIKNERKKNTKKCNLIKI